MAINFSIGDNVVINRGYVDKVLPTVPGIGLQTLGSLGYIGDNPSVVLDTGTVGLLFYIRVRPRNILNPAFNANQGTIVFFPSEITLNNSFELSTAYIDDKCIVKVLNTSGSTIAKGSAVYQTSFNDTQQLPTIALASASASSTAAVLGLASADIENNQCGSVIISGAFEGLNTSSFAGIGDRVFLSNTPGMISNMAGTTESIIGRILAVDIINGSMSIVQSLGGSGGGGTGQTGVQGDTGIQGLTGMALGATGIQGIQGTQGDTGIAGGTGVAGVMGTLGNTGIQGSTGAGEQGVTGLGAGGGFFSDGAGTDAGIGKGASAPTAAGVNALAQGNGASAAGDNSVAFGTFVTTSSNNTFVAGQTGVVGGDSDQTFIQGEGNTTSGVTSSGGRNFIQGRDNSITGSGTENVMVQGNANSVTNDNVFAQGDNITVSGNNSFAQGEGHNINRNRGFAFGYNNYLDSLDSMAAGADCYITDTSGTGEAMNVAFGNYVRMTDAARNFGHGYSVYIYNSSQTINSGAFQTVDYGENFFLHGRGNTADATGAKYNIFCQGYGNTVDGTTENAFVQGYTNTVDGNQVMVQGQNSSWAGGFCSNVFAQGDNNDFTGSLQCDQIMVQGQDISVGGEAYNVFVQGDNINARGSSDTFLQGRDHDLDGSSRARVFAQGANCLIQQDDQKVWGSNRGGSPGGAQSSRIVKFFTTVNSTTFGYNIDIDTDKTVCVQARVVARNTTTNAESACFVLSQALVYNDAGTAVLVGSPSFTQVDSGGGASSWNAGIGVSGSEFQITYTGDASDTVMWLLDIEYSEVAG